MRVAVVGVLLALVAEGEIEVAVGAELRVAEGVDGVLFGEVEVGPLGGEGGGVFLRAQSIGGGGAVRGGDREARDAEVAGDRGVRRAVAVEVRDRAVRDGKARLVALVIHDQVAGGGEVGEALDGVDAAAVGEVGQGGEVEHEVLLRVRHGGVGDEPDLALDGGDEQRLRAARHAVHGDRVGKGQAGQGIERDQSAGGGRRRIERHGKGGRGEAERAADGEVDVRLAGQRAVREAVAEDIAAGAAAAVAIDEGAGLGAGGNRAVGGSGEDLQRARVEGTGIV